MARFTTQEQADWLSVTRMQAWLTANGYCGRQSATTLHAHLAGAPRGSTGADGAARAPITRALLAVLTAVRTQIRELETAIAEALRLHPDGHLFTSLPRAGTLRAARLLAEIGDCRARFPTADSLACLAGVAPSTRRSGKRHAVTFRWAADKQLRDALTDVAGDSRRANLWAARTYDRHKQAGKDHAHITRILARSWSQIIWRCWQDRIPYDPNRHRALQAAQHSTA